MEGSGLVGGLLVAGLGIFLMGAVAWRWSTSVRWRSRCPPLIGTDARWAWIHVWMVAAMLVTPAGLTGLAVILDVSTASVLAAMAAAVCLSGAVCWIASLAFRLTVVPWAAERVVSVGDVPDGYVAYDRWAGALYCAHLLTAYLASAVLGVPCSSRTSCRRGSAGPASGGGSPALTRLTCAAEAVTG